MATDAHLDGAFDLALGLCCTLDTVRKRLTGALVVVVVVVIVVALVHGVFGQRLSVQTEAKTSTVSILWDSLGIATRAIVKPAQPVRLMGRPDYPKSP